MAKKDIFAWAVGIGAVLVIIFVVWNLPHLNYDVKIGNSFSGNIQLEPFAWNSGDKVLGAQLIEPQVCISAVLDNNYFTCTHNSMRGAIDCNAWVCDPAPKSGSMSSLLNITYSSTYYTASRPKSLGVKIFYNASMFGNATIDLNCLLDVTGQTYMCARK